MQRLWVRVHSFDPVLAPEGKTLILGGSGVEPRRLAAPRGGARPLLRREATSGGTGAGNAGRAVPWSGFSGGNGGRGEPSDVLPVHGELAGFPPGLASHASQPSPVHPPNPSAFAQLLPGRPLDDARGRVACGAAYGAVGGAGDVSGLRTSLRARLEKVTRTLPGSRRLFRVDRTVCDRPSQQRLRVGKNPIVAADKSAVCGQERVSRGQARRTGGNKGRTLSKLCRDRAQRQKPVTRFARGNRTAG